MSEDSDRLRNADVPQDLSTGRPASPREVRAQLQPVMDRLIADYPHLPAGSVVRCVARCSNLATRPPSGSSDIGPAVERLARLILDARSGATIVLPSEESTLRPSGEND
ncbi:MAG: hypothetical protein F2911_02995 [Actinobacteria bacterium]|uniref:Unannotated protein n=2 Tax=freshwater metagenome TaxID=449393 RepID=A0A6J7RDK5_9ZZZZ|nr:hypothetical protein [Actinomycetota bacterium]